jgi:hypothetical protein
VTQVWQTIRAALGKVWSGGVAGRELASARGFEPSLSPDLDFHLREDAEGRFVVNCRGQRVTSERLESLATGIDRLLAHIREKGDSIPDEATPFRNPWGGQAFAIDDLQLTGVAIDVNLSRRAGTVEIDVPIATAEHPLNLSPELLERFADVIRQMIALREAAAVGEGTGT